MLVLQIVIALIIARVIDTRIVRPILCGDSIYMFGHRFRTRKCRKN